MNMNHQFHYQKVNTISSNENPSEMNRVKRAFGQQSSPKANRSVLKKYFGCTIENLMCREHEDGNVPRLVKETCEYLLENGLEIEGIFRMNGNLREMDRLKNLYDQHGTANMKSAKDMHSVASLLKLWLRELPDGLINFQDTKKFINVYQTYNANKDKEQFLFETRNVLGSLTKVHFETLLYIINLLTATANLEDKNRMSAKSLGIVLGPSIFRVTLDVAGLHDQSITNTIIEKFIENMHELFTPLLTITNRNKASLATEQPPCRPPPPKFQAKSPIASPRKAKGMKTQGNLNYCHCSDDETLRSMSPSFLDSDRSEMTGSPNFFNSAKMSSSVENIIHKVVSEELFGINDNDAQKQFIAPRRKSKDVAEVLRKTSPKHEKNILASTPAATTTTPTTTITSSLESLDDTPLLKTFKRAAGPKNRRLPTKLDFLKDSETNTTTDDNVDKKQQQQQQQQQPPIKPRKIAFSTSPPSNGDYYVPPLDLSNLHLNSDETIPAQKKYGLDFKQESVVISPRSSFIKLRSSDDTQIPPSPPLEPHCIYAEKAEREQANTLKSLTKKINSVKKKIKHLEKSFEETYKYVPSEQDKRKDPEMSVLLEELNFLKKQLKSESNVLPGGKQTTNDTSVFNFTLQPATCDELQVKDNREPQREKVETRLDMQETVDALQNKLDWRRSASGRPNDINAMTYGEIADEKVAVQKALLQLENKFGRPTSKVDKDIVRPLYNYYRNVKRCLQNRQTLEALPEHSEYVTTTSSLKKGNKNGGGGGGNNDLRNNEQMEEDDNDLDMNITQMINSSTLLSTTMMNNRLGNTNNKGRRIKDYDTQLHELSMKELFDERTKVLNEKKEIRKLMKKELPPPDTQTRYRQTKARLKLVNALLNKHTVTNMTATTSTA